MSVATKAIQFVSQKALDIFMQTHAGVFTSLLGMQKDLSDLPKEEHIHVIENVAHTVMVYLANIDHGNQIVSLIDQEFKKDGNH